MPYARSMSGRVTAPERRRKCSGWGHGRWHWTGSPSEATADQPPGHGKPMIDPAASALLTDLYELTMLQAYRDRGMNGTAVFEFFWRKLPQERNFLIAAGLEQVVGYLRGPPLSAAGLPVLENTGR